MRPIVNMSKEDRATVTGNMHKKFDLVKIVSMVPEISWQLDRQTDRQTDPQTEIVLTIL